MGDSLLHINGIGGVAISGMTLIAATYLLISLWKQGRGKLRVRLLLGMVISDLLLGAIIPESYFLSNGVGLLAGTRACDAQAFILTAVLFTQHCWTLAIAIATFLLLRHPLSRWTSLMERYSWTVAPIIWAVSILHSGIWMATVGFDSSGIFCYYGSHPIESARGLDAKDLVQFIPRTLVFIIIAGLYSFLFNFLRRPDTIQLSSQFVSGGISSELTRGTQMGRVLRRLGGGKDAKPAAQRKIEPVNPDAPWEQLEFVQVGGREWELSPLPTPAPVPVKLFDNGPWSDSLPPSPKWAEEPLPNSPILERTIPPRFSTSSSEAVSPSGSSSQRPSETETFVTPQLNYSDSHERVGLAAPKFHLSSSPVIGITRDGSEERHFGEDEEEAEDKEDIIPNRERRTSGQTLKEFFQEHQAPGLGAEENGRGFGTDTNGKVVLSAATYFNRQASLLMLYFPLAYMVVFSVSLVRLIYTLVHKQPSAVLTLMSSWMVLSIGLIDGLVYGVAEFVVRRRVRRKMPDRM